MKINISGSIELGQSFPTYVQDKFDKEFTKLFENISFAEVRVKKQSPNTIFTSISVNDVFKKGVKIDAEAEGDNVYRSFDEAFKKLLVQIKKEKDKAITNKKKGKE